MKGFVSNVDVLRRGDWYEAILARSVVTLPSVSYEELLRQASSTSVKTLCNSRTCDEGNPITTSEGESSPAS